MNRCFDAHNPDPAASPPGGWVYEEKVDGYRMLIFKDGDGVRLVSRQGDHTRRFPGLVEAVRALRARPLLLDGEVASYDEQLVSRFEWRRSDPGDEIATPPMFMALDLLQLGQTDLRPLPLRDRGNGQNSHRSPQRLPRVQGPAPFCSR